jgi:hypothetical protein
MGKPRFWKQSERWFLWHTQTQLLMWRIGSPSLGLTAKPIIYPLARFANSGLHLR